METPRYGDADGEICPTCKTLVGGDREASRLLGFALFNLEKGKTEATKTLIKKAIVSLGREI